MSQVQAKIAQREFEFDAAEIERRLRDEMPEPLGAHFAVVAGKRFPPKQVIGIVTDSTAPTSTHTKRVAS
jgi:hypothetical protein